MKNPSFLNTQFVSGRGCGKSTSAYQLLKNLRINSIPEFTLSCVKKETPLYGDGEVIHIHKEYSYEGYNADGIHVISANNPREIIAYFCYMSVNDKSWYNAYRSEYGNPEQVILQNPSEWIIRTKLANISEDQ